MGQRFYKIIVVCLVTLWVKPAKAQTRSADYDARSVFRSSDSIKTKYFSMVSFSRRETFLPGFQSKVPVPADHYITNLGFFCRKEYQVEKHTKLPLRFRLGSLAYCNYLEGKK